MIGLEKNSIGFDRVAWTAMKFPFLNISMCLLTWTVATSCSSTVSIHAVHVYSDEINDSFIVQVDTHGHGLKTIDIFVLESSEKKIQHLINTCKDTSYTYRFISVNQTKPSKRKRRRDFVPPRGSSMFDSTVSYWGEADKFNRFLTSELIPNFSTDNRERVLIGHSFGGLFTLYASLQSEPFFNYFVSTSPSLWVNHRAFHTHYQELKIIKFHQNTSILYGKNEVINKVKPSCEALKTILRSDEDVDFIEVNGNHYSSWYGMSLNLVIHSLPNSDYRISP